MSHPPTDTDPRITPSVYLTEDIPPIGGVLKQRPEDFVVEELPLYQPCGEGEHIYLMVEKRGLPAMELNRELARHFGVPLSALGYAGLKDRQAVTRQVISIHTPGRTIEDFPSLRHESISVLWADQHTNKLRRGHLAGNRFSIRVRGVEPHAVLTAKRVLDRLRVTGVPDRFGEQGFGYLRNNHLIGRALLVREHERAAALLLGPSGRAPERQRQAREAFARGELREAARAMPKRFRTERVVCEALAAGETAEQAFDHVERGVLGYYVSAFQSAVFNRVLDDRVAAGRLAVFTPGDVAMFHAGRAMFDVDEVTLNDPETTRRLGAFEISPSGPMWGPRMRRASGEVDRAEAEALEAMGLTPADLEAGQELDAEMIGGTRRPLRVPVENVQVEGGTDEHGPYVRCAFDLPRGAFATVVMGEIMKSDRLDPAAGGPAASPAPSEAADTEEWE